MTSSADTYAKHQFLHFRKKSLAKGGAPVAAVPLAAASGRPSRATPELLIEDGAPSYLAEVLERAAGRIVEVLLRDEDVTQEIVDRVTRRLVEHIGPQSGTLYAAAPATADALAAARRRGAAHVKSLLEQPDNMPLDAAAAYAGLSSRHINEMRNLGRYYALVADGSVRGYRYPQWQFDAAVARLEPVLKALAAKRLSCWAVHDFLLRPHAQLGRSPREAILDDTVPIALVIAAVTQRFDDADQGAA